MAELSRLEEKEEDKLIESLMKKSYFSFNEINKLMQLYREQTIGLEPDKVENHYRIVYLKPCNLNVPTVSVYLLGDVCH